MQGSSEPSSSVRDSTLFRVFERGHHLGSIGFMVADVGDAHARSKAQVEYHDRHVDSSDRDRPVRGRRPVVRVVLRPRNHKSRVA